MLTLPASVRIYLATGPVDLRASMDSARWRPRAVTTPSAGIYSPSRAVEATA
jgi:hypothetical protein